MAVNGKTLQSYDLEWQWVRAYWGNYVLGEDGRWTDPKVGFRILQLYREYVWRAYVPIREQNSTLVRFLGNHVEELSKCATYGDSCYSLYYEDRDNSQVTFQTEDQYSLTIQGRGSILLTDITQPQLRETIRRCYRVHNALAAIKMTKGARANPELLEEINTTMGNLKRRLTIAQRYIKNDPFPSDPSYVDGFIEHNRWWVKQIQDDDPFIGRQNPRNPMETLPWPYYIGISKQPLKGLGAIRTELKGRMAIARHRTRNVDDPNKRVVLKRYLAEVVHDVTNVRTKDEEPDPYEGEDHGGDL